MHVYANINVSIYQYIKYLNYILSITIISLADHVIYAISMQPWKVWKQRCGGTNLPAGPTLLRPEKAASLTPWAAWVQCKREERCLGLEAFATFPNKLSSKTIHDYPRVAAWALLLPSNLLWWLGVLPQAPVWAINQAYFVVSDTTQVRRMSKGPMLQPTTLSASSGEAKPSGFKPLFARTCLKPSWSKISQKKSSKRW